MPHRNLWLIIFVLAALAISCSGVSPSGSGDPINAGILLGPGTPPSSVAGSGNPQTAVDGPSDQTAPVMDVGNPNPDQEFQPEPEHDGLSNMAPVDLRVGGIYQNVAFGVRIAYPVDWSFVEEGRTRVRFTASDGQETVTASFAVSEQTLDELVATANDSDRELEEVSAIGFDRSVRWTFTHGSIVDFEQYAGKDADGGTLVVVVSGSVVRQSPWLNDCRIEAVPPSDGNDQLRERIGASPLVTPREEVRGIATTNHFTRPLPSMAASR